MQAVPFDQQLTVAHIVSGDVPLACPRGVPIFVPAGNDPRQGSVLCVYRCALLPGHDGNCEPDKRPAKRVTVCGIEVSGTWINWPTGETRPCPACNGAEPEPTLL